MLSCTNQTLPAIMDTSTNNPVKSFHSAPLILRNRPNKIILRDYRWAPRHLAKIAPSNQTGSHNPCTGHIGAEYSIFSPRCPVHPNLGISIERELNGRIKGPKVVIGAAGKGLMERQGRVNKTSTSRIHQMVLRSMA
jgi:hypothetical protein